MNDSSSPAGGPLDVGVEFAGRGTERKLQHNITAQLEDTMKDLLHEDVLELAPRDPVRVSYLAASRFGTSVFTTYPSKRWHIPSEYFTDKICEYLGLPSPALRGHVGALLHSNGGRTTAAIDAYGVVLDSAVLPGGGWNINHDHMHYVVSATATKYGVHKGMYDVCRATHLFASSAKRYVPVGGLSKRSCG